MSLDILVDQEKLSAFAEKVYKMAREEFGTCDEGKINKVAVHLIDRSRCWPLHYFAIPYDHKAKTEEEREKIFDYLLTNLKIATEEVQLFAKLFQEEKRAKKKRLEEKK